MLRRDTLHCPSCQGENVRDSRWHDHQEKTHHPGRRPVRCVDCGHRFLADARPLPIRAAAAAVAATAAVALLGFAASRSWHEPEAAPSVVTPINAVDMKAAEGGDAEAQFKVGSALLADAELEFAYSGKAITLLEQAAGQGHTRAMLRLGLLYRKGVGALQNYGLAAKWIDQAARRGDPQAMLELGRLYREGIGMASDPVQAYVWFNRAAAARDPDAPFERKEVTRLLTPDQLRQAQDQSAFAAEGAADPPAAAQ